MYGKTMMEFTVKQLSWIVITALTVGVGGYVTMTSKIEDLDKRLAVVYTHMDHQSKTLDKLSGQLERIEQKLENNRK